MIIEQKVWPVALLINVIQDMQPGFARRPNLEHVGIAQLRTNNISNEGNIDLSEIKYVEAKETEIEKYGVYKGDVIFNNTNSPDLVGRAAYFDVDRQFVLSNHMTRLRVDPDLLDAEFLARYLNYLWHVGASSRWAKHWVNQAAIDQAGLEKFEIPIPPLPEQRRIVAILRKADELRQLRRQANQRAEDLPNAIMSNLFGEFSQYPKKSLDSLCGFITKGTTPDSSQLRNQFGLDGIPFLKVLHITDDGEIDFDKEPTFVSSQLHNTALSRSKVFPGDIIINIVGPPLGRIGMVPSTYSEWNVNQALAILRPNPGVSSVYLFHILRHPLILPYLLKQAVGVRQLNLSLTQVRNFEVPMPDLVSQKTFDKHLRQITLFKENQKYRDQSGIDLENLFQSLISRAFTGELTATWRDTYSVELTKAAAERDRLLELAKPMITGSANVTLEPVTLVAIATIKPSRAIFADLDTSSQTLLTAAQTRAAYFRPEDLIANQALTAVQAEAGLHVLEALGFVRQVALEGQLVYRTVDAIHESAAKPEPLQ